MIAAAAALFGSELIVGGFRYVVKPPTVAVALAVTAALEHGGEEGPRAVDAYLREAVAGWLPRSLRSVLFSEAVTTHERQRVIAGCMLAGIPDERLEQAKRQQERVQEQARARGWDETLSTYRRVYGAGSASDVLSEPWPLFLNQADRMDAEEARQNVGWAMAYASVRAGGESWSALMKLAGYPAPSGGAGTYRPETEEERAEARAQVTQVRAQLESKKRFGTTLRWKEVIGEA